ncbi:carboxymuconolactone decarboxylase family protein [Ferruginibacter profundus]
MQTRFDMAAVEPGAYKAMIVLDNYAVSTAIPPLQKEMIKIRASQINGCAYCVNMHVNDARKHGEVEQRIHLISVWPEAGDIFTEEEQLILAITEEITLISKHGLSDALYEKAIALMGKEKTAQVIMNIITINAWNRIGVSLKMHPKI